MSDATEPKVTLHPEGVETKNPAPLTPSAELIAKAISLDEVIEDPRGRKIRMKKPGVLAQYRLVEALGPLAENQVYMQMVNPLIYIAEIDGDPVFLPNTKLEIEALLTRLDDDGIGRVLSWYMVNVMGPTMEAISAAEKAAQIKN